MKNKFIIGSGLLAGIGGALSIIQTTHSSVFQIIGLALNPLQVNIVDPSFGLNIIANFILGVAMLFGLFAYSQNPKNYRILLFGFIVTAMQAAWSIVQLPLLVMVFSGNSDMSIPLVVGLELKSVVYLFLMYKSAKMLMQNEKPSGVIKNMDSFSYTDYHEPSVWLRLRNWAIDNLMIMALFAVPIVAFAMEFSDKNDEESVQIWQFGFYVVALILYFFLSESLFGTTAGKAITGTRVYDEEGSKATIPQLLGRTLVRVVPLEPLSFVMNKNWHDSWSGTRVFLLKEDQD